MKHNTIHYILLSVFLAGILPIVSSCSVEDEPVKRNGEISFRASIRHADEVETRAIVYNPVTTNTYGKEMFYIHSQTAQQKNLAEYKVAAGVIGQLTAADPNRQLLWHSKNVNHLFRGWTMPWQTDTYKIDDEPRMKISFLAEDYEALGLEREQYYNCRVLETFVGAKTDPLNYDSNGEDVEMYFQHLVSKIHINALKMVDNEGYTSEGVVATMTFYQMPQSAIFDRLPVDGGAPRVEMDPDAKKGVACTVGSPTTLYVCPGIDFSKMEFSVHIEGPQGTKGDYFGDFRSVIFKRTDTDQPEWDEGKSTTVLYAGEEMTIDLTIRDGNAGGISVNISNWSDRGFRNATGYSRQGIFSNSELLDIYNKFQDGYTQEEVDEIFDLYGEEVDGEKVIYLYEDAQMSHTRMPMAKGLILDGTGHTVQLLTRKHDVNGKKDADVAHVGPCRNIFITDGTHIIYIDEGGTIWTVNSETLEMTKTEHTLPPLEGANAKYNSYYIDYETGDFQLSESY